MRFACCGHGDDHGYIAFENGVVVRPHRRGQLTVDDVTLHFAPDGCTYDEQGKPRAAYGRQGYYNLVAWLLSTAGHQPW